jgi:acyl carrier protein
MTTALDRSGIDARVKQCVASALSLAAGDIDDDTSFGSLPQWDSMGHMTVVLAVEQEFGVAFESYQIAELTSVSSIVSAVIAHGGCQ